MFLISLFFTTLVKGGEDAVIELFNRDYYSASQYLYLYHDESDSLSIEDVIAADQAGKFNKNQDKVLNFGFLDYPVWIRFDVSYPDSYPNVKAKHEWYLEVAAPLLDVGELYEVSADGQVVRRVSDIRSKFADREVNHVYSVFPITFELGEQRRFYVKMQTAGSFYVPIKVWDKEAYTVHVANEEFIYGMFYGSMLCIIVFNLLIYFSVRDVGYLYYVVYLFGISLLFFIDLGHGVNLLDNGGDLFHKNYLSTIIWINWIAVVSFLRSFLESKKYNKLIDAFYTRVILIAVIYMVLDFIMPYKTSISWGALATQLLFLAFAPICIYLWRRGNVNALYFLIAWGFNMLGLSVYAMISLGYLPPTTFMVALAPLGILSEAVLLSFALADRMKRTQRSLVEADQRAMAHLSRYQSVFSNALEGIYQLSLDGRFLKANQSMARNLGFASPSELAFAGKTALAYCYPNPEEQYKTLLERKTLKEETHFTRRDGQPAWADHSARLIMDEDGNPSHIEGTFIDITERKKREEALRQKEQERVEKEIAKTMAAAKTEFLASMSHEIRTPLSSIIGYSEAIKLLSLTGSEREDAIKTIAHSSQQLLSLINEILDYSKIEAGKFELEEIPLSINDLALDLQKRYEWQANNKGLGFSIKAEDRLPDIILSDPVRIKKVLHCLLDNAIKYTKQGAIELCIQWLSQQACLQFKVIDTGVGMNEEELSNLFDVFTRREHKQARKYGGSRLSLAIAKELAHLFGGDLTVRSSQGVGTEFTFTMLPKLEQNTVWLPSGSLMEQSKSTGSETVNKLAVPTLLGRVLLAEDNQVNQKLISKLIAKTGARVTVVENGREAVTAASENDFDLILMDINMPIMGGLEACQQLCERGVQVPIYALTAETCNEELAKATACGCKGHLGKPVDRAALYEVMSQYLAEG